MYIVYVPTDIKLLSSKTKYNMGKAVVLDRIDQTIINYLPPPNPTSMDFNYLPFPMG
jgi:hypothetical protein